MIETLNTEHITCPICEQEHDSQVIAFPKTLIYKDQKLSIADYYHTCPIRKEFFQTDRDIIETWKLERVTKKQIDTQPQFDPNAPFVNGYPIGMTMNINGQNMAWTGREWVPV